MDTLKDFLKPEVIWFLLGIILLVMEFAVPGIFILFFGIGAILVALVCLIFNPDPSLNVQLIIFIGSSFLLLVVLRRWLKSIFIGREKEGQSFDDTIDDIIGQKVIVARDIKPGLPGKVEFRGTLWNAEAGESIKKGTPVEITAKDNITLTVKKID